MECELTSDDGRRFVCRRCGRVVETARPYRTEQVHARCRHRMTPSPRHPVTPSPRHPVIPSPPPANPQSAIFDLQSAISTHLLNGTAGRSAVEIEALLAICRQCEEFTGDGCRRWCGCTSRTCWIRALVRYRGRRLDCPKWPRGD